MPSTRRRFILGSGWAIAGVGCIWGLSSLHANAHPGASDIGEFQTTMATKLIASPRLYVTAELASKLNERLHSPFLQTLAEQVIRGADYLVRAEPLAEGQGPSYSVAGRWVQSHLECLTCAWVLKRKAEYRRAAMKHLAGLLKWNQISCEANAQTPASAVMPFCLTYGEQSTAIALMYDHFRPDLTAQEQKVFFDVIDRFHLKAAVKCLTAPPWWANKSWSNWNGVCSGGMGMMALAFHEDRREAPKLVPFVEKSLAAYFSSYVANGGGCPEGTGYWNYGMNYSMRYVLSWENATGKKHPALKIKELGESLLFPVDFTGLSFGDNDGWHPACFYFMLAQRTGLKQAAMRAAAYLPQRVEPQQPSTIKGFAANGDLLYAAHVIPSVQEMAQYRAEHQESPVPVARVYRGMEWAVLADDEAFPSLRMSIRGGSAKVMGHGMIDLLSFHCRVNGELMITDQHDTGYLTTTFGGRGTDLYTRGPDSKSTLFVEGLGCAKDASCEKTELVSGSRLSGVRIDATRIYLPRLPARFIGRLFLFVDNAYWLVIDHVLGQNEVTKLGVESRFHTYAQCKRDESHASLRRGKAQLRMTFAALHGGVIQESRGMPPLPKGEQTTILRWMGAERQTDSLHVVALNPGEQTLELKLSGPRQGRYSIEVKPPGGAARRIRLDEQLHLL